MTIDCRTAFKLVNRKGEDFLEVQDLKWTLGAGTSHFQFNNMFNGDKILGKPALGSLRLADNYSQFLLLYRGKVNGLRDTCGGEQKCTWSIGSETRKGRLKDIKMNLKSIGSKCVEWIHLALHRDKYRVFVNR